MLVGSDAPVRVARVLSGDLIELEDGRRVRYKGVDAPRPDEPFYNESLRANRELVGGKQVLLKTERDLDPAERQTPDGALLCYVLISADQFPGQAADGFVNANLAMIRSGSAAVATQPAYYRLRAWFENAQQKAKQARLGIWRGS